MIYRETDIIADEERMKTDTIMPILNRQGGIMD